MAFAAPLSKLLDADLLPQALRQVRGIFRPVLVSGSKRGGQFLRHLRIGTGLVLLHPLHTGVVGLALCQHHLQTRPELLMQKPDVAHQLLLKRDGRCGDDDGSRALIRIQQKRNQVGKGFSNTDPSFHQNVLVIFYGVQNLERHIRLPFPFFKIGPFGA